MNIYRDFSSKMLIDMKRELMILTDSIENYLYILLHSYKENKVEELKSLKKGVKKDKILAIKKSIKQINKDYINKHPKIITFVGLYIKFIAVLERIFDVVRHIIETSISLIKENISYIKNFIIEIISFVINIFHNAITALIDNDITSLKNFLSVDDDIRDIKFNFSKEIARFLSKEEFKREALTIIYKVVSIIEDFNKILYSILEFSDIYLRFKI